VRLWAMDLVMIPPTTLGDSKASPLIFLQQTLTTSDPVHVFGNCLGKDHMPELIGVVKIFLGVLNLLRVVWHDVGSLADKRKLVSPNLRPKTV